VYKINCKDYALYVGQMKRQLKTRLHKYIVDVNKKSNSLSVIFNHRLETNHEINWNDVKIVDNESSCIKKLISDVIYLKKQPCGK